MKIKLTALIPVLATFLFVSAANAQNHNSPAGKGLNGQQPLGVYTDGATAVNDTVGAWGRYAVSENGAMYCSAVDGTSGLSQSVVPVSNSVGLNGTPVLGAGYHNVSTVTATTGSTTTVIAITGIESSARVGDAVQAIANTTTTANRRAWGTITAVATNAITVSPAFNTAPVSGDTFYLLRPVPLMLNSSAGTGQVVSLPVLVDAAFQPANTTTLLKLEDAASASGDALVGVAAVRNEGTTTLTDTNLDYGAIAVNRYGAVNTQFSTEFTGLSSGSTSFPYRNEDAAFGDGYATMVSGGQSLSAIAQSVSASGDVAPPAQDLGNRQIVTNAPSGEMVVGCNTAITTATTGSMIAAVASKFTFITSWQCTNTGGAASRVILEDGDGTDLANLLVAATTGFAQVTFPTPVRTNVVNKAIQVNVITTGTSTICCASGYTGAI